jgi:hypothetical protein
MRLERWLATRAVQEFLLVDAVRIQASLLRARIEATQAGDLPLARIQGPRQTCRHAHSNSAENRSRENGHR